MSLAMHKGKDPNINTTKEGFRIWLQHKVMVSSWVEPWLTKYGSMHSIKEFLVCLKGLCWRIKKTKSWSKWWTWKNIKNGHERVEPLEFKSSRVKNPLSLSTNHQDGEWSKDKDWSRWSQWIGLEKIKKQNKWCTTLKLLECDALTSYFMSKDSIRKRGK
jgi:hypothetical protein